MAPLWEANKGWTCTLPSALSYQLRHRVELCHQPQRRHHAIRVGDDLGDEALLPRGLGTQGPLHTWPGE